MAYFSLNKLLSEFCFLGEKDVKRREAVRRKTAQYLLKAEALYNTYLVASESPEKSEQVSGLLILLKNC